MDDVDVWATDAGTTMMILHIILYIFYYHFRILIQIIRGPWDEMS